MYSEDPPENNTKTIVFMEPTKKQRTSKKGNPTPPPKHEKAKRVVTTTKLWNFSDYELCHEYQKEVLVKMNLENPSISTIPSSTSTSIPQIPPIPQSSTHPDPRSHIIKFIYGEIQKKIYGYKCQDLKKELFSSSEFVNMENIIKKLMNCKLMCYYCKDPIYILYEYVREPRQWTLERINNAEGHTTSNTEIACLKCNLSRRCMFHERYLFTKQISNIIKK
jgi:hypothetical protein